MSEKKIMCKKVWGIIKAHDIHSIKTAQTELSVLQRGIKNKWKTIDTM